MFYYEREKKPSERQSSLRRFSYWGVKVPEEQFTIPVHEGAWERTPHADLECIIVNPLARGILKWAKINQLELAS